MAKNEVGYGLKQPANYAHKDTTDKHQNHTQHLSNVFGTFEQYIATSTAYMDRDRCCVPNLLNFKHN